MEDNSSVPDPVVTRLAATLRAHADTVEYAHPGYESLRRDIRRARRRRLAACTAGVAAIAVAGGIAFTSSGAALDNGSPAGDRQASWSGCRTDGDGRAVPAGATKARLARAIEDYGPTEGRDTAQRKLLEAIVCQVDQWAHGSDGLGYRVMWRGTFASGATGVVLRVTRGADTIDFVDTSYGRRSHAAVPTARANEASRLVLEAGRTAWEMWAPPGSAVELYEATTHRLIGAGTTNDKGYTAIFSDRAVDPATPTRAVTVLSSGIREDGPLLSTRTTPEECRVLFRTPTCEPTDPAPQATGQQAPTIRQ
ncbi:hypothetical protein [Embleya sp. NPDC001921]